MKFKIKLNQFFKALILLGFVYQSFDLFFDYLCFNYSIELEILKEKHYIPSITLCFNKIYDIYGNYTNLYNLPIKLETILFTSKNNTVIHQPIDQIDHVRYLFKEICLTHLYSSNYSNVDKIYLIIKNFKQVKLIFHQQYNPSHFERQNIVELKTMKRYMISMKKSQRNLLPAPYDTDCQEYSRIKQNNNGFKSQTECKLDFMRRKELEICGKNYYWIHHSIDNNNQSMNLRQTTFNCTVRVDEVLLNWFCKPNCESITLNSDIHIIYTNISNVESNINSNLNLFLNINHLPEINLIILFSNFGGLISMYFGLGIYDLALNGLEFLSKLWRKLRLIIYKSRISQNIGIICNIIKFSFMIMMIYQLYDITIDYKYNNQIIEIDFKTEMKLPIMAMGFDILMKNEVIKKDYPKFYKEIKLQKKQDKNWLIRKQMKKILLKKFSVFNHITGLDTLSIDCRVYSIDYNLDCSNVTAFINTNRLDQFFVFYQFFDRITDKQNYSKLNSHIDKVTIKVVGNINVFAASFVFYQATHWYRSKTNHLHTFTSSLQNLFANNIHYITFETRIVRQQQSSKCHNNDHGQFPETYIDHINLDCFNRKLYKKYGCLPLYSIVHWKIRLYRDLYHFNYKICRNVIKISDKQAGNEHFQDNGNLN